MSLTCSGRSFHCFSCTQRERDNKWVADAKSDTAQYTVPWAAQGSRARGRTGRSAGSARAPSRGAHIVHTCLHQHCSADAVLMQIGLPRDACQDLGGGTEGDHELFHVVAELALGLEHLLVALAYPRSRSRARRRGRRLHRHSARAVGAAGARGARGGACTHRRSSGSAVQAGHVGRRSLRRLLRHLDERAADSTHEPLVMALV